MEEDIKLTFIQQQRLEKSEHRKEYYQANKEKIKKARRNKELAEKTKICNDRGIPDIVAEYAFFREDGSIHLAFKDETVLFGFLVNIKFKSKFELDLFKGIKE